MPSLTRSAMARPRLRSLVVWAAHAASTSACTLPSAHAPLPPNLAAFLRRELALRLPGCDDADAAALIAQLAAIAPEDERNAFCQKQGERIARALQRDVPLRQQLLSGDADVQHILSELDRRATSAKEMFDAIQGHHHRLRTLVDDATDEGRWEAATTGDADGLRRYAEAAAQISTREWTQQGIDWCAAQAVDFFQGARALRARRVRRVRRARSVRSLADNERESPAGKEGVERGG